MQKLRDLSENLYSFRKTLIPAPSRKSPQELVFVDERPAIAPVTQTMEKVDQSLSIRPRAITLLRMPSNLHDALGEARIVGELPPRGKPWCRFTAANAWSWVSRGARKRLGHGGVGWRSKAPLTGDASAKRCVARERDPDVRNGSSDAPRPVGMQRERASGFPCQGGVVIQHTTCDLP
jgi:hypothetical protein